MIGDGMGPNQEKAAELYLKHIKKDAKAKLETRKFQHTTLISTNSLSGVTDSAAAGTALSTGEKTKNQRIGLSPGGKRLKTIAEIAKENGMKVGLISDAPINHATPAAFYAHVNSRHDYSLIASFIPKSNFDYFAGDNFLKTKGKNEDLAVEMEKAGYLVAKGAKKIKQLKKDCGKTIAIESIQYKIDEHKPRTFALSDFLGKAIELLDNPKGFFIMVEGGKIDWACHAHDIGTTIKEVLEFNNAVKTAYDFYLKHPDETLIIVTADHETGELKLSDTASLGPVIDSQRCSSRRLTGQIKACKKNNSSFEDTLKIINKFYGLKDLSKEEKEQLKQAYETFFTSKKEDKRSEAFKKMYGSLNPIVIECCRINAKRAGVSWGTFWHSGTKVETAAIGVDSEMFKTADDNTKIPQLLKKIICQEKPKDK
jgi:alkaline phosphatase